MLNVPPPRHHRIPSNPIQLPIQPLRLPIPLHLPIRRIIPLPQQPHPDLKALEKPRVVERPAADLEDVRRDPLDLLDREVAVEDVEELWEGGEEGHGVGVDGVEGLEVGVAEALADGCAGEEAVVVEKGVLP